MPKKSSTPTTEQVLEQFKLLSFEDKAKLVEKVLEIVKLEANELRTKGLSADQVLIKLNGGGK